MSVSRRRGKPRKKPGRRQRTSTSSRRFVQLLGFLMVLFGIVAVRLVWVQAVTAGQYAKQARVQRLRDVEIPAQRGTIYDREGEPLAASIEARTIYANPRQVKDKTRTAQVLAEFLGDSPETYVARLSQDKGFVYIKHKVDLATAKKVERLRLAGVGFLEDSERVYPNGQLACQVLGFVGDEGRGLWGLEQAYNQVLAGKNGTLIAERDPFGREIPGGVVKSEDPVQGEDIVLTIDKDIQQFAQTELARAVKKWGAKGGTVVVMSPKTGEIYAMASTPYFDVNQFGAGGPDAWKNRAACDAYEPGSTLKALLAASAIDAGRFTPESKLQLPSHLKVGGETIKESHPRGAVTWSVTDIVTKSSNIGAAKIGLALGASTLYKRLTRFGLGQPTGVDYPGESAGSLPVAAELTPLRAATVSFGQGVSVTALQLSRALGALANAGVMNTPHFLLSRPSSPEARWPTERVVTAQTASAATRMLRSVVAKGTGTEAKVAGYPVAGKTGTAQVARSDGLGYARGVYNSSFIGYLPADDPEVVICVVLNSPTKAIYGGAVAAPAFATIGRFCMEHLNVTPTQKTAPRSAEDSKTVSKTRLRRSSKRGKTEDRGEQSAGGNSGVTETPDADRTP